MTVPYPQLLSAVAEEFGLPLGAVALHWRMLREAQLEPAGSRGPKAKPVEVGYREAAVLLLGLLGSESARGAPDAVNELLQLEFTGAAILPDTAGHKVKLNKAPISGLDFLEAILSGNIVLPTLEFLSVIVRKRDDRTCLEFQFFDREKGAMANLCYGDIARDQRRGLYRDGEIRSGSLAKVAAALGARKSVAITPPKKTTARARVSA